MPPDKYWTSCFFCFFFFWQGVECCSGHTQFTASLEKTFIITGRALTDRRPRRKHSAHSDQLKPPYKSEGLRIRRSTASNNPRQKGTSTGKYMSLVKIEVEGYALVLNVSSRNACSKNRWFVFNFSVRPFVCIFLAPDHAAVLGPCQNKYLDFPSKTGLNVPSCLWSESLKIDLYCSICQETRILFVMHELLVIWAFQMHRRTAVPQYDFTFDIQSSLGCSLDWFAHAEKQVCKARTNLIGDSRLPHIPWRSGHHEGLRSTNWIQSSGNRSLERFAFIPWMETYQSKRIKCLSIILIHPQFERSWTGWNLMANMIIWSIYEIRR